MSGAKTVATVRNMSELGALHRSGEIVLTPGDLVDVYEGAGVSRWYMVVAIIERKGETRIALSSVWCLTSDGV